MRFKLDENLPAEASRRLREAGFDAMSVLDQGMGGSTDDRLAKVCKEEGRVFLTFDIDFANIRSYPPREHTGLVVFRLLTQEKQHLLAVLARVMKVFETSSPKGQLWIVEDDRIRIRE